MWPLPIPKIPTGSKETAMDNISRTDATIIPPGKTFDEVDQLLMQDGLYAVVRALLDDDPKWTPFRINGIINAAREHIRNKSIGRNNTVIING
jgi:hypothetical protein